MIELTFLEQLMLIKIDATKERNIVTIGIS